MKKLLALYGFSLLLYVPALLTNYVGACPGYSPTPGATSCWQNPFDFYESTFIFIALLDFIPLSLVANELPKGIHRVAFMVTGAWMLILAMPDIYLSYVPWVTNYQTFLYWFSDYNAYWFGDASFVLLLLNLYFFAHLTVFSTRIFPKGRVSSEARTD
jgi:hypothetical protein